MPGHRPDGRADDVETAAGDTRVDEQPTDGHATAAAHGRTRPGARWPSRAVHGRPAFAAAYGAFGIVLFLAYLAQARTLGASFNGAGQALQAWDMLHGNLLLHSWYMSDVSFYTTELPEYMLVELVRGLNSDTIHVAAALSYTLVVLLGGLVAKGKATGREGMTRLLIAVGIMLAPNPHLGTYLFLAGPDHIGTHVPLLLIWLLIDRAPRRWWVPALTGVLLVWAQIADELVLVEGAAALAAACAIRVCRRRGPLRGLWYDLGMIAGAAVSAGAAKVVLAVIRQAGGFYTPAPTIAFAGRGELISGSWAKIQNVLDVFGANFFTATSGPATLVALAHLAGLALALWAVCAGVRGLFGETELLMQLLTIAFVMTVGAYFVGVKPGANEIVGLLPIGAVLAGRLLAGRPLAGRRLAGPLRHTKLIPVLAAVLASYAVLLGVAAAHRPAPAGTGKISAFLEDHQLTYGLADYPNANDITMKSGGKLQLRPVGQYADEIVSTLFESNISWYDPKLHNADFIVWSRDCAYQCVSLTSIVDSYGKPSRTYHVSHFEVLVYHHNLLASLGNVLLPPRLARGELSRPAKKPPCTASCGAATPPKTASTWTR